MSRLFPIADLRALTARALQLGDYSPSSSGRIRVVPDMRTIRYYTTLGLIDGPAAMRGRTALYDERHVMQLVAIKRLQANHQTLSDIQTRLYGITTSQLRKLAELPDRFWEDADAYLTGRTESELGDTAAEEINEQDFWALPAALPGSIAQANDICTCTRIQLHPDLQIIVTGDAGRSLELAQIKEAAAPLLEELARQGLLPRHHRRNR